MKVQRVVIVLASRNHQQLQEALVLDKLSGPVQMKNCRLLSLQLSQSFISSIVTCTREV